MYQIGVMNYQQGSLAWLTRGRKFGYKDIVFDADFYAYMVEQLTKFWVDYIQGDQEPPAITIDDVMLKFPRSIGKAIEVNDEIMDSVNELRMVKSQLDELTKQKKSCEDAIKAYMADADTLCLAGTKDKNPSIIATWKTAKDSLKFNEKLFASEHADLYNQYMTNVTGSRRFLVK
jgi:predicted phage-related endonuclease